MKTMPAMASSTQSDPGMALQANTIPAMMASPPDRGVIRVWSERALGRSGTFNGRRPLKSKVTPIKVPRNANTGGAIIPAKPFTF
ncbi:MAG: hypothetical protein Q8O37_01135 [Sulfuricellaceae bacterium]|nr:hypothetical protein [Sulfuricellaceae bacterium]